MRLGGGDDVIQILTSDGQSVPAHAAVLATASPVLARMIDRARRGWRRDCSHVVVPGVPAGAAAAFVQFLHSSEEELSSPEGEKVMSRHAVRLLALGHVYRVGWLKRRSEAAVAARLTPESAVDMLKLAKLCDAPRLYLRCARVIADDFAAVERTDGWRFVRRHDRALQLEILQFIDDEEQRARRWKRERAAQELYMQLSEAMDALERIFSDDLGKPGITGELAARQGLQTLMRHFASCNRKHGAGAGGGCVQCKRLCQLFRLHSSLCSQADDDGTCKVPLCKLESKHLPSRIPMAGWKVQDSKLDSYSARLSSTRTKTKAH